ncbi:hypothetical protein CN971_31990 [Bacillus thuringiensis]|uniref:Uncharacterized protein n=1 Tax=Bacillus thuringiensis TaxID=1428 RepID=A0A9X7GCM4_BACTU|nr:hypothetical protein [Bacillus thuringiensis]PFV28617.1 hypothetical protein COK99_19940 [Bacillus thuringiensis]PGN17241.1 hypothetical protein CN971_31990 [Bacillus thuringiensis]PGN26737.1 hypothetical protein CN969_07070 [Bacillus thuringiensis]
MLKKDEVLYYLVNTTYYVGVPFQIASKPLVREDLIKQGYLEDKDELRFTTKAVDLLNEFYADNSNELMKVLRELKVPGGFVSYNEICKEMNMSSEEFNVMYLMKRLAEDGEILISASSDWDKRVKYIIN